MYLSAANILLVILFIVEGPKECQVSVLWFIKIFIHGGDDVSQTKFGNDWLDLTSLLLEE